jgi:hypothetical protein
MDVEIILELLARAEKQAAQGAAIVSIQRAKLEQLRRDGHDTAAVEGLLAEFERSQAMHLADIDTLREQLARLENPLSRFP